MTRDSCVFYRSFYEAINELDDDQAKLAIYEALFAYALDGVEPEDLKGTPKAILRLIRPVIDKNNQNFMNAQKKKTNAEPKEGQTATDSRPNEERPTSESNLNKDVEEKGEKKDADVQEKKVLKDGRARGRARARPAKGEAQNDIGRRLYKNQRTYDYAELEKQLRKRDETNGDRDGPGSGTNGRPSEEEGDIDGR